MKVLILADPSSAHTIKWANSLNERGVEVFLFGLSRYDASQYHDNIQIDSLKTPDNIKAKLNGNFLKLMYLVALPKLKRIINSFNPDILHAHYAASYGVISALTGFRPYILSVWGIDILTFPNNSVIHKSIVKIALKELIKFLLQVNILQRKQKNIPARRFKLLRLGLIQKYIRSRIH